MREVSSIEGSALSLIEHRCRDEKFMDKRKMLEQLDELGIEIRLKETLPADKLSLELLSRRLDDSIHVHNGWARTVSKLQTALVRYREGFDINVEITQMHFKIEQLEKEIHLLRKDGKQRSENLRKRLRALEDIVTASERG